MTEPSQAAATESRPPERSGIIWAIVALHAAAGFYLCWELAIWVDESFSLITSGDTLRHAFQRALVFELQPPAYFVSLWLWRCISDSVLWARLFGLTCTTASVFLVAGVSKRWLPNIHPAWLTLCFAFNPFVLWAASEIRVYATVILLATLLMRLLYDGFFAEEDNPRARWLYALVCVLALYSQYYLGFMLVANAAALLATRRWRMLWKYVLLMALVGLCFSPMLLVLSGQVLDHTETSRIATRPIRAYWLIVHHIQEMVVAIYNTSIRSWLIGAGAFGFAALVAAAIGWRQIREQHIAIVAIAVVGTAMYAAAVFIAGPELVGRRHTGGLYLTGHLIPFVLVTLLPGRARFATAAAWAALIIATNAYGNHFVFKSLSKEGDFERVAEYIEERESENEPILVFPRDTVLPVRHYYHGKNVLIPLPSPPDFTHYDLTRHALTSQSEVRVALESVSKDHDKLWLINTMAAGQDVYMGVDFNVEILQSYLAAHYRNRGVKNFMGTQVMQLQKK